MGDLFRAPPSMYLSIYSCPPPGGSNSSVLDGDDRLMLGALSVDMCERKQNDIKCHVLFCS